MGWTLKTINMMIHDQYDGDVMIDMMIIVIILTPNRQRFGKSQVAGYCVGSL